MKTQTKKRQESLTGQTLQRLKGIINSKRALFSRNDLFIAFSAVNSPKWEIVIKTPGIFILITNTT